MARQKAEENPRTESSAYGMMAERLARSRALLGGTDAMREAAQDYLPYHPEETQRGWQNRIDQNVLVNFYEVTLDQLAAKPFCEPVVLGEDVPEVMMDHFEDVDLQGNTLDAFCIQWFADALRGAFSHVLVEFPRVDDEVEEPDGTIRPRNRRDDVDLRPYWVHIPPEQIIFASSERINGVETLTHVRILEETTKRDGFSEEAIPQIRVLEPGRVEIWRQKVSGSRRLQQWEIVEEWETGLDVIPLVTFYTDREGLMQGRPPLDDLAHLNIRHWQSMSDQIRTLTVSRFPMLLFKGIFEGEQGKTVIGPGSSITVPPNGDVSWLEATGAALEQGWRELEGLEDRMSAYGAQLLKKRPGNSTATARALDSAEATSVLQALTLSFQSALEEVFMYHAMWMGLDDGGSARVFNDFAALSEANGAVLTALKDAQGIYAISTDQYVSELKRRKVLSEDYDREADKESIENDIAEAMARMPSIDIDPEGADEDEDEEE